MCAALVGHGGIDEPLGADEGCAGRQRHRQGGAVVAGKYLDAHREAHRLDDGAGRHRHHRGDLRSDAAAQVRHVGHVLDENGVEAAGGQEASLLDGAIHDRRRREPRPRRAGERRQVHHADDGRGWKRVHASRSGSPGRRDSPRS